MRPINRKTLKEKKAEQKAEAKPRSKDIRCGHAVLHYVEKEINGFRARGWILPGGKLETNKERARETCMKMMNMINRSMPREERDYKK